MTTVNIPQLAHAARPVVQIENGQAITLSVEVARVFEKRHDHVLDTIKSLTVQLPDGGVPDFRETPYTNPQNGQTYPAYQLTRDGFMLLAMRFTGKRALAFQIAYIKAFNKMEAELLRKTDELPAPDHFVDANKKVIAMNDALEATGITPDMITAIVASTTQNLVATLHQKRKLIHWPEVVEALQNPKADMTFADLTALTHAAINRLQRAIDAQAYGNPPIFSAHQK